MFRFCVDTETDGIDFRVYMENLVGIKFWRSGPTSIHFKNDYWIFYLVVRIKNVLNLHPYTEVHALSLKYFCDYSFVATLSFLQECVKKVASSTKSAQRLQPF